MNTTNYIYREVAGEAMLVPFGKAASKHKGVFVLTEMSSIMYKELINGKTREDIIEYISNEYEADKTLIENDVNVFINKLKELEAV